MLHKPLIKELQFAMKKVQRHEALAKRLTVNALSTSKRTILDTEQKPQHMKKTPGYCERDIMLNLDTEECQDSRICQDTGRRHYTVRLFRLSQDSGDVRILRISQNRQK